jgi:hypothetical protein
MNREPKRDQALTRGQMNAIRGGETPIPKTADSDAKKNSIRNIN